MTISPETKQKIQLFLVAAILISAIRTGYILYHRHKENAQSASTAKQVSTSLNADYYVTPKKLYPYDLKSARQLMEQPAWVKEGYRYTYYPYNAASHHSDFARDAGTLLPLQKLQITGVVTDESPGAPDQRQVMAVFERDGKSYAVPIGVVKAGTYRIYSDEMLFIQDPHELYGHWPPDVWQSIDSHQVKPGMNELQTDFAIGMGMPDSSGDSSVKTVHYPNGGHPLTVVYREGKATEIKAGE
ncbi:MAG TPA: hypothetical protein VFA89_23855 [Terriglobales bacterium]|nr:hypothetical protein [Terriglobales bacterium]